MSNQEWKLTKERVTEFEFSSNKFFNMLISEKMFTKLENIAGQKKVKQLIEMIVNEACPVLHKVKTDSREWKMFQHLIVEEENQKEKRQKEAKKFKNGNERKHYHHFVSISIQRSEYYAILELHHRVNTFSMALIIRMMIEIFISLYEKYQNQEVALEKMKEVIVKLAAEDVRCNIEFILLKEVLGKFWRAVAFFQVEYFDADNNLTFFFQLRL